ncbi:STAS domain-containing protein [Streptomyces turgidiscabies]|uniref:Anti-anti-sigma regulatory factor n=1 Tax=Streptomyces turgidiscabies TaxID=85558 RepID=A0ABU0RNC1_9ACTN|nr:STAS domain-containing protein [Streptomyces turgidiscabies]MDQ0933228.1 anti-anti-sigma regulatory factor [Streptomyces turgidiscabies]
MDASHGGDRPTPLPDGPVLEIHPLSGRPGIRAAGEINVITRSSWEQALEDLASAHTDVSFVELSGLMFIDVGGAAALAVTAQRLDAGRIVVDRPPPELERILDMFWPGISMIEVAGR